MLKSNSSVVSWRLLLYTSSGSSNSRSVCIHLELQLIIIDNCASIAEAAASLVVKLSFNFNLIWSWGTFRINFSSFPTIQPSDEKLSKTKLQLNLNCIFVVTTPTQPQLNSKVGCDMKMTLIHHHPPTTTHHTNSMSAISQLLLARFQPDFKVGILGWTTTTTTLTTTLTTTTSHLLMSLF